MLNMNENLSFTNHALSRMSNRHITKEKIDLCINYGEKIHKTNIKFYIITKKSLKSNIINPELEGLCVLISNDNTVITTYKNKNAFSNIKKLSKRSLKCN